MGVCCIKKITLVNVRKVGQGLTPADKIGVAVKVVPYLKIIAKNLMKRSMKITKHLAMQLYRTRTNHVHTPVFHTYFG